MSEIVEKILNQLGDRTLIDKLNTLSTSELNTFLLELMRMRRITPSEMLKTFPKNRFVTPSKINPITYHKFESTLLELAQKIDINSIMLSPVAPLGNCSAFGCVNQNNVVSATRGTEVLADPTNMLATIIADKVKNKMIDNSVPKHFCTTARATRTQPLLSANHLAHFGIFCIVSSGKDIGSYSCEKGLLIKQLQYYKLLFLENYGAELFVTLRKRSGYTDNDGFFSAMCELIKSELPNANFDFDMEHKDNSYYKGINFNIYMEKDNQRHEIGDGGFVDWTQQMTGNKKERMLISGIGIERMMMFGTD